MHRRETKSFAIAGLKAIDTEAGTFEAIVSVFGNVDYHGHRIAPDAFDASLERWRESGDPIPVIFSHRWDDLTAYLGTADPAKVRALPPGDPDLPEAIRENGGLLVAADVDTTEPEGRKALKLLKTRAVREFSFAYDVLDEEKADDGFLDLLELDLIEVGPTLKGANPLTQLIGAKAGEAGSVALTLADVLGASRPDRGAKAFVSLPGTVERLQEAILRAGVHWAADLYGDNLYTVGLEGTYPADGRAVLYVELWDDPPYKGRYFETTFAVNGDDVTIEEPELVELVAAVAAKGRGFGFNEGRRNAGSDLERIQGIHDLTRDLGAECAAEDPDGEADEDGDDETTESRPGLAAASPGSIRAILDAELLDV